MKRIYEAWQDDGDDGGAAVALGSPESIAEQREKGLLGPGAKMLYQIEAGSWEEAQAVHALRMGWQPYRPNGEPAPCPRCGATFYPQGSGQCWRCVDGVD